MENQYQPRMPNLSARIYRVIVQNTDNEIMVCQFFESRAAAIECFEEFLRRYDRYPQIIIDAKHKFLD